MPIHPTPISCDMAECEAKAVLTRGDMLPVGWVLVTATERRVPEADTSVANLNVEIPQDAPPEAQAYLQTQLEMLSQLRNQALDLPEWLDYQGQACYCPKHAEYLSARLNFPDRALWEEAEGD